MAKKTINFTGGIGFSGALTLLFIWARLAGHVDWPWWLLVSPLWAPVAAVLAVEILIAVVVFIAERVTK